VWTGWLEFALFNATIQVMLVCVLAPQSDMNASHFSQ